MTSQTNWKRTTLLSLQAMNFISFRSIGSSLTYLPPHITRLNVKGYSTLKMVNSLFKKALKDNKDPWSALLDQRNTPIESLESNPTQSLMFRRIRIVLPTASDQLYPKIRENATSKLKLKGRRPTSTTIVPSAPYQKFRLGKRSESHLFRGIKLSRCVTVLWCNKTCSM